MRPLIQFMGAGLTAIDIDLSPLESCRWFGPIRNDRGASAKQLSSIVGSMLEELSRKGVYGCV